jgi:hypothetical protein
VVKAYAPAPGRIIDPVGFCHLSRAVFKDEDSMNSEYVEDLTQRRGTPPRRKAKRKQKQVAYIFHLSMVRNHIHGKSALILDFLSRIMDYGLYIMHVASILQFRFLAINRVVHSCPFCTLFTPFLHPFCTLFAPFFMPGRKCTIKSRKIHPSPF